ncbi:MAG TPA: intradiol ring-cleavage dioxygenase [Solirubrobacteraceae bacterium]|jgi:protocatechuate 3,4-dioxygenase beta subunit|nr:intradiol ring-cleavage dioxygenase [Solirubrobacteraceae bacterium]
MPLDDRHVITRRRSLAVLGAGAAGLWAAGPGSAFARPADGDDYVADAAGACMLTPEQEEGPFYVDLEQVRQDIADGQVGVPLLLEITVVNSQTCKPLRSAAVDIWHCNASGVYSDISSEKTVGETYLRGVQITDRHGQVRFKTIFPGHYSGRTTHIHARIHVASQARAGKLTGGHVAHTGQMFPPEAVYAEVYKLSPYSAETAAIVSHAADRVWGQQHGYEQQMTIRTVGHRLQKGLIGSLTMAVDPAATPALIGATSGNGTGTSGGPPTGTPPTGTLRSGTLRRGTLRRGTLPTGGPPSSPTG